MALDSGINTSRRDCIYSLPTHQKIWFETKLETEQPLSELCESHLLASTLVPELPDCVKTVRLSLRGSTLEKHKNIHDIWHHHRADYNSTLMWCINCWKEYFIPTLTNMTSAHTVWVLQILWRLITMTVRHSLRGVLIQEWIESAPRTYALFALTSL